MSFLDLFGRVKVLVGEVGCGRGWVWERLGVGEVGCVRCVREYE